MEKRKPMERLTFTFTEKECVLIAMTMSKANSEFIKLYRIMAKKRDEEMDDETRKQYEFYRDATLLSEAVKDKIEKELKAKGCDKYDFNPFEDAVEKSLKGGNTNDQ